jgi:hypothetical protein
MRDCRNLGNLLSLKLVFQIQIYTIRIRILYLDPALELYR